jgi:hypothetical protein
MFDPNAMHELKHIAADRYQRAGCGGARKVYVTEKAYFDAHGWKDLSPFQQACIEMLHRYRQICSIQREHYRLDCLTSKEGFYYGDTIPF